VINENAEKTLRVLPIGLVLIIVFLVWVFAKSFVLDYTYVIGFMFLVFCPVIIQLVYAITVLFIMDCFG
jgi:membrane protein YdbS with pleckstrin-like domain